MQNAGGRAASFFDSTNTQMYVKINRKVAFLSSTVGQKSQNIVVIHPSTPLFLSPFFKTFVTHPPKISELDTAVTATPVLRP